jgi:hypothetical protein
VRGEVVAALRQPPAGQLERRVLAQIVQIIAIGVAAGDGEDAGAQNVGHDVGDKGRVAVVRDQRGQRIDQAEVFVGTGQQQDAAVGADLAGIKGRGDLFLAETWQGEGQKRIVVVGGHGRFRPGMESGVDTQSLRDSRWLYHAHQRIPAMR